MSVKNLSTALLILFSTFVYGQENKLWNSIIGSAFLNNRSYAALEKICDEAGGRLLGSPQNEKAMGILKEELSKIGCEAKNENFKVPGWVRGEDAVLMTSPTPRKLQTVALGYVNSTPEFTAKLIYAGYGFDGDYSGINASGKIVLVSQGTPPGKEPLLRYEAIDIAASHGAEAILFINDNPGTLTLAGTGNFIGSATKIPAYSLTFEEGKWLVRLLERNIPVEIEMTTRSYCKEVETSNTVVSFKGKVKSKIVIGAHFDSWDVGQGGVDNGVGSAILFDVARLLKTYSPDNYYSIDLVWFNGEELGLWGSKRYTEMHKQDSIIAMINMDMTGSPTGFNAMGFNEFIPFFKDLVLNLNGFNLTSGVVSSPGTNSDHMWFMFEGIPTFELQAHLDESMYKYYHERGDTFDKVNKKYLSEAAAVVTITVEELANNKELRFARRNEHEMVELFKHYGLDKRLKRQHEWIYKEE